MSDTRSDPASVAAPVTKPGTYVLVHGAWHGGWCWDAVARILRSRGHRVFAPTLSGLGERAHLLTPEIGLDEIETGHDAMLSAPAELAGKLLAFA